MGCCGSKPSDETSAVTAGRSSTTQSSHHHHPKARRRYHNKRYPAGPANHSRAHVAVSPMTSLDDIKEVLTVPPTIVKPPRRRTNNSSNNSIESGTMPKPKKKSSGPNASSFSFEKSCHGERTPPNSIPLASDIWSITNSAVAPPIRLPSRGNRAIQLSSEIWSFTDGPPSMAPPMSSAAIRAATGFGPFPPPPSPPSVAMYLSPLKRESPVRREMEFTRKQNSYDSPGNRRDRRSPYLAGRERGDDSSFSRERRAVTISPQKRERNSSSSGGRKESGSPWSVASSIEMRRREDGSGRRKAMSIGRENDRLGRKNVRGGGGADATVNTDKGSGRGSTRKKKESERNDAASPKEQGRESSDSSLSIEGFVFL